MPRQECHWEREKERRPKWTRRHKKRNLFFLLARFRFPLCFVYIFLHHSLSLPLSSCHFLLHFTEQRKHTLSVLWNTRSSWSHLLGESGSHADAFTLLPTMCPLHETHENRYSSVRREKKQYTHLAFSECKRWKDEEKKMSLLLWSINFCQFNGFSNQMTFTVILIV